MPKKATVSELVATLGETAEELGRRWGPAALLHLPPPEQAERVLLQQAAAATTATPALHLIERTLRLLRAFPLMSAHFLPATLSGELVIGRGEEVELPLAEPSLSRRHVKIRWGPEGFFCRDLGSLNGTFLTAIALRDERRLQDGDSLIMGDVHFAFLTSATLFLQLQALRGRGAQP